MHIDPGIWISIVFRLLALIFYSHHTYILWRQYRTDDEFPPARLHRYLVLSIIVNIGVAALAIGGFTLIWPQLLDIARVFGALAGGAVFVGGVYIEISHRLWKK